MLRFRVVDRLGRVIEWSVAVIRSRRERGTDHGDVAKVSSAAPTDDAQAREQALECQEACGH